MLQVSISTARVPTVQGCDLQTGFSYIIKDGVINFSIKSWHSGRLYVDFYFNLLKLLEPGKMLECASSNQSTTYFIIQSLIVNSSK